MLAKLKFGACFSYTYNVHYSSSCCLDVFLSYSCTQPPEKESRRPGLGLGLGRPRVSLGLSQSLYPAVCKACIEEFQEQLSSHRWSSVHVSSCLTNLSTEEFSTRKSLIKHFVHHT